MPCNDDTNLKEKPSCLENVRIDVLVSPDWCNTLLRGNTSLRELHLVGWSRDVPDGSQWLDSVQSAAATWLNLHILSVDMIWDHDGRNLKSMMTFLGRCAVCGSSMTYNLTNLLTLAKIYLSSQIFRQQDVGHPYLLLLSTFNHMVTSYIIS